MDDSLFQIFPEVNINDQDPIIKYIENFYISGVHQSKVTRENDFVVIEIVAIEAGCAD